MCVCVCVQLVAASSILQQAEVRSVSERVFYLDLIYIMLMVKKLECGSNKTIRLKTHQMCDLDL